MGDMAATDVTVTLNFMDRTFRRKRHEVTIAFGDGSLTYPTNGVPLPAKRTAFQMHAEVDRIDLPPVTSGGYFLMYDKTYYTLRIFKCAGTAAPAAEISGTVPTISVLATVYGA